MFAVDNKPKYLDFVRQRAEMAGLNNIEGVAIGDNEVSLLQASLDLVFARNVFHHLSDPEGYFRRIKNTLKFDGKVAIVERIFNT